MNLLRLLHLLFLSNSTTTEKSFVFLKLYPSQKTFTLPSLMLFFQRNLYAKVLKVDHFGCELIFYCFWTDRTKVCLCFVFVFDYTEPGRWARAFLPARRINWHLNFGHHMHFASLEIYDTVFSSLAFNRRKLNICWNFTFKVRWEFHAALLADSIFCLTKTS